MRFSSLVNDYLFFWILLSVVVGLLYPPISYLTRFSTIILAVMIGSISLTLSVEKFRGIDLKPFFVILGVQTTMPFVAFGISQLLSLSPELTLGFVVLGAVTPELVTPVMTELAGGDTVLSTTVLVTVGFGSMFLVPGTISLLVTSSVEIEIFLILRGLFLAVILPMTFAISLRYVKPESVSRYDDLYPSVSAVMVIIIIGVVTAENASTVFRGGQTQVFVAIGCIVLNLYGYLSGWLTSKRFEYEERIASVFCVGMRDFAVAAALVVSTGLPTIASLPAVVFGIFEMLSSAGLARYLDKN